MTEPYSFRKVFLAAGMGMLLFGIVIITLGSILPALITKFHLNELNAGYLASLLPLGILAGSLFFGPVVDRYSYQYLLIICSTMVLAGMEGIAFTNNISLLHISIFLIGLGGGAINGGTNALVADISSIHPERRSANLSLLGVFFGIGALGMPFIMGFLSPKFSYESILSLIGATILLPVVYYGIIRFPKPKQPQGFPIKSSFKLAKDVNLVLLGLFLFFQSGIEGIINNWTTIYLMDKGSFVESEALFALSIFVFSLTITRVLLAVILNRVRPYIILIISITFILAGILCLMYAQAASHDIIGLILLGSGLAAGFPVILGYVGDLYSSLSGTAFSLVFVIALTGNILANYLMGIISHSYGLNKLSIILIICVLCLACILVLTLTRISNKTRI